jgi:hypothetical protein
MSTTTSLGTSPAPAKKGRAVRTTGGAHLGNNASRDAKCWAAAILDVLAGMRTPSDAALALAVSLPRYYQVESRALAGLLEACEPKPKGRQPNPGQEMARLRREQQRLQQDLVRQQALVRAAQRTIGLTAPVPPSAKGKGKKRCRRSVARALSVARRLQAPPAENNAVGETNNQEPSV